MKNEIKYVAALFLWMFSVVAQGSLVGDFVSGELTENGGGAWTSILTPFSSGSVQVVDPGIEFTGIMRKNTSEITDTSITVNIYDNYFTVKTEAASDWGLAIGHGLSSGLFDVALSSLDLIGGIGSITFNETLSYTPYGTTLSMLDDIIGITSTSTSATVGFDFVRDGAIYAFQLQAVPVPAAVWLFGSGLLGLIGIAKRKKA